MKIALLTAYTMEQRGLARSTVLNKQNYCECHGYTLITVNVSGWHKMTLIMHYLEQYDYILWSDTDSLIMNKETRIEDIIRSDHDIIAGIHWINADTGAFTIHTGNFIVRNSAWSLMILHKIRNSYASLMRENGEETALTHIYLAYPGAKEHISLLPLDRLCSFPLYFKDTIGDFAWKRIGHNLPLYTGGQFILKVPEPLNMIDRENYLLYATTTQFTRSYPDTDYISPESARLTEIFLQTATGCNSRCVTCPHPHVYGTRNEIMHDALWTTIVDSIKNMQFNGTVAFSYNYEPFLDPSITRRIHDIRTQTFARSVITTNVSAITDKHVEEMKDSPPDLILASMLSGEKTQYEKMTGLSFNTVVERINMLSEYFTVMVNGTITQGVEKEPFMHLFNDGIEVIITGGDSRGGLLPQYANFYQSKYFRVTNFCTQPFHNITIRHDGKIPLCCMDWGLNTAVIGDVTARSIHDIFYGDTMATYRRQIYHGDYRLDPCKACAQEFNYKQKRGIV